MYYRINMRKLFVLLEVLSISFKCVFAKVTIDEENKEIFRRRMPLTPQEIDNFLRETCESVGGTDAQANFSETRETLKNCLNENLPKVIELPSEICKKRYRAIRNCIEKAIPMVGRCFNGDLKWLIGNFLPRSFYSAVEYLCGNVFISLKELMSLEGMDCIMKITFNRNVHTCLNDRLLFNKEELYEIQKEDVCKEINLYENCLTKIIRDECPVNKGLEHLVEGFIDAVKRPCRDLKLNIV